MNAAEAPRSLGQHLRRMVGRILRATPLLRRYFVASASYRLLSREQALAVESASGGWFRNLTAQRQQKAFDGLLTEARAGNPRIDLAVVAEAIQATRLKRPSVLEVGCGGGYYSEILELLVEGGIDYSGLDYSQAMIDIARRTFPGRRFEQGDATCLPFPAQAYDIVVNGASLMHILDFEAVIAESRRVARQFCIYSTVPVFVERETTYVRKHAYGAPVVEVLFNRADLFAIFERNGLELAKTWASVEYDVHPVTSEHSLCETYLLKVRT